MRGGRKEGPVLAGEVVDRLARLGVECLGAWYTALGDGEERRWTALGILRVVWSEN